MNKILFNVIRTNSCRRVFTQSYHILRRNYCFKSDLSLEKLYPTSNLRLYTPPPPPIVDDKFNGYIPLNKIDITYSRSSGPGGQNVNCVNTKVDIRFHLESATWLSQAVKDRMKDMHSSKLTKEGYFVIKSELTRSQYMNVGDALEKLRNYIRAAEKPEKAELSPETVEKFRRKHEKAARERLMLKRKKSDIKSSRQT